MVKFIKKSISILILVYSTLFLQFVDAAEERQVLIIGGNFSLEGQSINLAQLDIKTGVWSNLNEADLYLYGESNGVILDMAVNKSSKSYNVVSVVGAFDTVTKASQIQYCSVGMWDGISFDKVV